MRFRMMILGILVVAIVAGGVVYVRYFAPQSVASRVFLIPDKKASIDAIPEVAPREPAHLLMVGDIMVGRTVETLIKQKGIGYPLEQVQSWFTEFDKVIANLEGPINQSHAQTPHGSTRFSFAANTTDILKEGHVGIVSLANNHLLDYGVQGLIDTRHILHEVGIDFFGDPTFVAEQGILSGVVQGHKIIFISFNDVAGKLDAVAAHTLVAKAAHDESSFVIVFMHWGDEYKTVASKHQTELAHAFIDEGADLIVGAHPHVVQNIERYHDRAIFYSLGNFVFDQYFSKETQEGLALGVTIADGGATYDLYPIDIVVSQPIRTIGDARTTRLAALARHSDASLLAQIKEGTIPMMYVKKN